jgi:hypothetical protein
MTLENPVAIPRDIAMTPEDRERMNQLCTAIQQEQDAKKLTELADELDALLLPKSVKRPDEVSLLANTPVQR